MRFQSSEYILWTTRLFAPRYYPVRLVTGDNFWFYKGDHILGFSGEADNGWRDFGSYIRGGIPTTEALLPHAVQLTWLAETERKFYQVQIPLPREEILEMFEQPITVFKFAKKKTDYYKAIDFAFEPEGRVHLRVSGLNTRTIGTYDAEEIPMEWWYFSRAAGFDARWITEEKYFQLRSPELPESVQERYTTGNIPKDRWLNYHKNKYPWKIVVKNIELEGYRVRLTNGDFYWVSTASLSQEQAKDKQIPTEFIFNYRDKGIRYRHTVYLTDYDGAYKHLEQPDGVEALSTLFTEFFSKISTDSSAILQFGIASEMNNLISNLDNDIVVAKGEFVAYLNNGQKIINIPIHRQVRTVLKGDDY